MLSEGPTTLSERLRYLGGFYHVLRGHYRLSSVDPITGMITFLNPANLTKFDCVVGNYLILIFLNFLNGRVKMPIF